MLSPPRTRMKPAGVFGPSLALVLLAGCGSAHLRAGQRYVEEGELGVAIELFDAGLAESPNDEALRDALISAQQLHELELRHDRERLESSGRYVLVLGRLLQEQELARRTAALKLPGGDVAGLESEQRATEQKAADALAHEIDVRMGRGQIVEADLVTCRQLAALRRDEAVERTCARLLGRLKWMAALAVGPGSHARTAELFAPLTAAVQGVKKELFAIVPSGDESTNATLDIFVGAPEVSELPWTLVEKDAFHTWVPVRDKKGEQIEETVTVEPTQSEIDDAKCHKRPPPEPKKVKKKVWELTSGTYRHYRQARTVRLPYTVTLRDERGGLLANVLAGGVDASADSTYHEYQGDPRARRAAAPPSPEGKGKSARLPEASELVDRAFRQLPKAVAQAILEKIAS